MLVNAAHRRRRIGSASVVIFALLGMACSTTPEGAEGTGATPGPPPGSAPAGTPAPLEVETGASVTGPVTGGVHGEPFLAMPAELAEQYGYVEEEFFLDGTATSYVQDGEWGPDGRWSVQPDDQATYRTRLLVRRPADPAAADGTVLVEWLNVSSGQDVDVIFSQTYGELLAHGTTWVGVSVQPVGISGGGAAFEVPGISATPLTTWDPQRYGELTHPGDDFGYDLFAQAGAVIRSAGSGGEADRVDLLGGIRPEQVIGAGESQSAARLTTFVNAIQPLAQTFDGFLIHSRSKGGSILHQDPGPQPPYAWIRDDLGVPVLQFQTETDLFALAFVQARQPDTPDLRTWEVAGTAHLDQGMLDYRVLAARPWDPPPSTTTEEVCGPVNRGPQGPVLRRAVSDLRQWVDGGDPPAAADPLETTADTIRRDELGVALGGVRTPPVDAPIEVVSGEDPDGQGGYLCALFGSTQPLAPDVLAARYPDHDTYVGAVTASAQAAVASGHLLEVDAQRYIDAARASAIGR